MISSLLRILGLFILCFHPALQSVESAPDPVINISAAAEPSQVTPGSDVAIKVTALIDAEWHIYSVAESAGGYPTRLAIEPDPAYTILDKVEESQPLSKWDEGFMAMVHYHEGRAVFTGMVRIAPEAGGRTVVVRGVLHTQACSDTTCLEPEEFPFQVEIEVAAGSSGEVTTGLQGEKPPVGEKNVPPPAATEETKLSTGQIPETLRDARIVARHAGMERDEKVFLQFLQGGLDKSGEEKEGWFLLLAAGFIGGLIALATPCVYPMIPITVSFFTKLGEERKGGSLGPALLYCFGIILSFTLLGLILTLILGASGTQDFGSSPVVNGLVALLFIVFAFSLFGLFELKLPRFLTRFSGAAASGGGRVGVLLMGLTFSVTSFACTGPFIGAILAGAATTGYLGPTLAMIGFSTALAIPFFFLALIPQIVSGLPKSGGWMVSIKIIMGFLELAAAFKFLGNADQVLGWNLLSRATVVGIWVAICLAAALYLFGFYRFAHEGKLQGVGALRMTFGLLFLAFSLRMLPALFGGPLGELDAHLPPQEEATALHFGGSSGYGPEISWFHDLDQALSEAGRTGKPLFLNFTGHT